LKIHEKEIRKLKNKLRVANMKNHVMQLCLDNDIDLEISNYVSGIRFNGIADFEYRSITIPEVIGERTYFTAMHELGHFLEPDGDPTKTNTLRAEVAAWDWSIENSIINPTKKVKLMISRSLQAYHVMASADKRYKIPDKSDRYWIYLNASF
jgi:Zn-dependent peptidase ImmA (M78 family)